MTYDRDEYRDLLEEKKKERNGSRVNVEMIRQASIKMEHLTGIDEFDTFLSYLQTGAESLAAHETALKEALCSLELVDDIEIRRLKTAIAVTVTRRSLLEEVMSLPKRIQEYGKNAKFDV